MTGERGSFSGRVLADVGYSSRAARLPPSTLRSTAPAGLAAAIGASRPSRASVSVPLRVDLADARRRRRRRSRGSRASPAAAAPG